MGLYAPVLLYWCSQYLVKRECAQCKKAKARIVMILQHSGRGYQNVSTDDDNVDKRGKLIPKFPAQKISPWLIKDYFPDVYFEKKTVPGFSKTVYIGIIEVDHDHNKKGHFIRDTRRDKHFLSKGIPTIRFDLKDILGINQYHHDEILDLIDKEIKYQLNPLKARAEYGPRRYDKFMHSGEYQLK